MLNSLRPHSHYHDSQDKDDTEQLTNQDTSNVNSHKESEADIAEEMTTSLLQTYIPTTVEARIANDEERIDIELDCTNTDSYQASYRNLIIIQ